MSFFKKKVNTRRQNGKVPAKVDEDPDSFYQSFDFSYTEGKSKADVELRKTEEQEDERIFDLCLIMDCTGSMSSWIELCKRTLKDVISDVLKDNEELDVRVGFVAYRDFGDGKDVLFVQDFTFDVEHVKSVIGKQTAKGGADTAEDVQGGLYQGLNLSWRKNSVKICYLCADAPGHGSAYNGGSGDDYPGGHPAGLTIEDMMTEYSNREIDFAVYELNGITKSMYEVMEQAYNQGENKEQFRRIELVNDIREAQTRGESLTAGAGLMESAYRTKTSTHAHYQTSVQKMRKGW